MAKMDLTAQRLRELLHYNPETGVFMWREKPRKNLPAGCLAGGAASGGYWRIRILGSTYLAHRLAWLHVYATWPGGEVDHINGERTDNRIANLRDVTRAQNSQNQSRAHRHSTSRFLGASFDARKGKWSARILADGVRRRLGMFDTAEEAHAAYVEAKRLLHVGCTI